VGTEVIQNTTTNLNRATADDCEIATNHVCFDLPQGDSTSLRDMEAGGSTLESGSSGFSVSR
jgi:hypothetical protein